jgi:uncharacterized membrane protein HdeD (DUF308 family)
MMNKPAKLAFSDEATFKLNRGVVIIPFVTIIIGFVIVLVTTDAPLTELVVPCVGTLGMGSIVGGIFGIVALGHRIAEKRAINRMFAGEIWECWQFRSSEWQALVEAECNLISPRDEGLKAYVGAVYSSIVGLIIAIILIAVGVFAMDEPEIKSAMWITAVGVFLLLVGIGLFQPMAARTKANRYRRKSLRVTEPRVWFASDDVYHETRGHTSLKELEKVTDQTRSRKAIQFTLSISTESSTYLAAVPFPVPSGCEERAGRLVRRYRQERLLK